MGHGHHHHHGHGHGHHHHHGDLKNAAARRALWGSLILNGLFLFVEAGVGFYYGSLALLSDAAHMVSDVAALVLALIAATLATRPASPGRTFGMLRAEILGAFVNAVLLVVACVFIFKEAVERLVTGPPEVAGGPVLVVAIIGLMINLGSAWFLWRSDSSNLNIRGALAHMLADALGSFGALVSAVLIMSFGWYAADTVMSVLIGVLVLYGAWGILKESTRVLLAFAPASVQEGDVTEALTEIDGVSEVHDLHVWTAGSEHVTITAHLVAASGTDHSSILRAAEDVIRERFEIEHSTLQIDSEDDGPCPQRECPLFPTTEHVHAH